MKPASLPLSAPQALSVNAVQILMVVVLCWLLPACGSSPQRQSGAVLDSAPAHPPIDVLAVPDAVPRSEPLSRYGNPPRYSINNQTYHVLTDGKGYVERGIASWYGEKFHGNRTSSGEPYDMYAMTAAHRTLPIPSYARVTHVDNGKSVVVRINDRGPFHKNRLIDLSYTAAVKLGIQPKGTGLVEVQTIDADKRAPTVISATSNPTQATRIDALYLQLGAFNLRRNAEQLVQKLKQAELQNLSVNIDNSAPSTPYRVRIGPLASLQIAAELSAQLIKLGFSAPYWAK